MFACEGGDIGFGKSDKKVAIIKIGAWVGSDYKSDLIDFPFDVDLILKVVLLLPCFLPDGGWFISFNLGDIICISRWILFWTSKKRELL